MPKVSTKKKVSPGRAPHIGRRPKARVIGPDVLCTQPMPPKKPRKPRKPRVKKPPAIVAGPPIVLAAPASGSAVRSMAGSLAAAKLANVRHMLKDEAAASRAMDISQTILFAGGLVFLCRGATAAAVWVLAIGTFVPMLIRRTIAKLRDSLMP